MPVNDLSRGHEQNYQGVVLLGRYRVLSVIGRGGMASVWRAEHLQLGAQVAVKFTRQLDPDNIARFHQEAKTSAQLNSPHIVHVYDVGVHEGAPFLVMELLEGESLAELLLARGRLSFAETRRIVSQVATALRRAHERNVIHRDLKPSNLFLVATGKKIHVKLLDFGAARVADSERTRTGDFMGTPHYMSPEQALDARRVGPSSDLWSLALIAYQCLVGRRAIQGRNLALVLQALGEHRLPVPSHHAELPAAFDAWFERATKKDPQARFLDAGSFAASLEAALDEHYLAPREEGISLPLRSRALFSLRGSLAMGILVLFAVVAGGLWLSDSELLSSNASEAPPTSSPTTPSEAPPTASTARASSGTPARSSASVPVRGETAENPKVPASSRVRASASSAPQLPAPQPGTSASATGPRRVTAPAAPGSAPRPQVGSQVGSQVPAPAPQPQMTPSGEEDLWGPRR